MGILSYGKDMWGMSTSSSAPSIRYFESSVEHALVLDRSSEEQVNFSVDHFGTHHTLTLAVFDLFDSEQPELKEQVILNYQEARLLRDLLNRSEVSAILDTDH